MNSAASTTSTTSTSTSSAQSTERTQETAPVADLGEQQFMNMLTQEVIPRLVLLEEEATQITPMPVGSLRAMALRLAEWAVEKDLRSCQSCITALLREGYAIDRVLLEVVQPAARHLGKRWNDDSCNFADVTLGMWNIQQVFTDLLVTFERPGPGFFVPHALSPSVLFCTLPGCQHRLGVQMVSAFFARSGWITQLAQAPTEQALLEEIRLFGPDLVGLSVSSERDMRGAAEFISRVRSLCTDKEGRGPSVMIGGPAVTVFPELARQAGADFLAGDAPEAIQAAEKYLKKDADRGPR